MKSKKETTVLEKEKAVPSRPTSLFDRENVLWMVAGAALMILGYLLMGGGASEDPNVFNPDEVYSARRITIAPILILAGLVIEIFALFRHPKNR